MNPVIRSTISNLPLVLRALKIAPLQLRSASPYFQNKTARQEICQIDLLIDTKYTVYVCEIKFQQRLKVSVVDEVLDEARKLKISKGKSLRRVLIHTGEIAAGIEESGTFDELIAFEQFLQG